MIVVFTPTAQAQLDHQIAYSKERFGQATAERTATRVEKLLNDVVARYPRSGTRHGESGLFETTVPRTPFVVIYRIEADAGIVRILGFFHGAQDRSSFAPE